MRIKVDLNNVTIDQENTAIQTGDIRIEGTKIIIGFPYFIELEKIFGLVRKGFEDFKNDFEFRT